MSLLRVLALFSLVLVLVTAVRAADAPELERLRTTYKAAVGKATKPILEAHVSKLEKVRDVYTRAANLEGANKVQGVIDRSKVAISLGEFNPPAADSNDVKMPELDKLRAGYDADIERAIKPHRETYVRELDRLRDNYTRAANLADATAAQGEIDAVKSGVAPGKAPKSEWYIGKTWTDGGTEWTFARSGHGEVKHNTGKKTPLEWEMMPTGVIKLQHEMTTRTDVGTAFMSFTSPVEGRYGLEADKLTRPLRPKQ